MSLPPTSRETITEPRRIRCRQSPGSPCLNNRSFGRKRSMRAVDTTAASASGDTLAAKWAWIARRMKVSSTTRLTSATELISLFIERRGVSITTQPGPALTVAERRRPEIRLISPKNSPEPRRTMRAGSVGEICTSTTPSTTEKKVSV